MINPAWENSRHHSNDMQLIGKVALSAAALLLLALAYRFYRFRALERSEEALEQDPGLGGTEEGERVPAVQDRARNLRLRNLQNDSSVGSGKLHIKAQEGFERADDVIVKASESHVRADPSQSHSRRGDDPARQKEERDGETLHTTCREEPEGREMLENANGSGARNAAALSTLDLSLISHNETKRELHRFSSLAEVQMQESVIAGQPQASLRGKIYDYRTESTSQSVVFVDTHKGVACSSKATSKVGTLSPKGPGDTNLDLKHGLQNKDLNTVEELGAAALNDLQTIKEASNSGPNHGLQNTDFTIDTTVKELDAEVLNDLQTIKEASNLGPNHGLQNTDFTIDTTVEELVAEVLNDFQTIEEASNLGPNHGLQNADFTIDTTVEEHDAEVLNDLQITEEASDLDLKFGLLNADFTIDTTGEELGTVSLNDLETTEKASNLDLKHGLQNADLTIDTTAKERGSPALNDLQTTEKASNLDLKHGLQNADLTIDTTGEELGAVALNDLQTTEKASNLDPKLGLHNADFIIDTTGEELGSAALNDLQETTEETSNLGPKHGLHNADFTIDSTVEELDTASPNDETTEKASNLGPKLGLHNADGRGGDEERTHVREEPPSIIISPPQESSSEDLEDKVYNESTSQSVNTLKDVACSSKLPSQVDELETQTFKDPQVTAGKESGGENLGLKIGLQKTDSIIDTSVGGFESGANDLQETMGKESGVANGLQKTDAIAQGFKKASTYDLLETTEKETGDKSLGPKNGLQNTDFIYGTDISEEPPSIIFSPPGASSSGSTSEEVFETGSRPNDLQGTTSEKNLDRKNGLQNTDFIIDPGLDVLEAAAHNGRQRVDFAGGVEERTGISEEPLSVNTSPILASSQSVNTPKDPPCSSKEFEPVSRNNPRETTDNDVACTSKQPSKVEEFKTASQEDSLKTKEKYVACTSKMEEFETMSQKDPLETTEKDSADESLGPNGLQKVDFAGGVEDRTGISEEPLSVKTNPTRASSQSVNPPKDPPCSLKEFETLSRNDPRETREKDVTCISKPPSKMEEFEAVSRNDPRETTDKDVACTSKPPLKVEEFETMETTGKDSRDKDSGPKNGLQNTDFIKETIVEVFETPTLSDPQETTKRELNGNLDADIGIRELVCDAEQRIEPPSISADSSPSRTSSMVTMKVPSSSSTPQLSDLEVTSVLAPTEEREKTEDEEASSDINDSQTRGPPSISDSLSSAHLYHAAIGPIDIHTRPSTYCVSSDSGSALDQHVNLENCYEVLCLAKKHDLDALKSAAYKVMSDHYLQVLQNPSVYGRLNAHERDLLLEGRMKGRRFVVVADIDTQASPATQSSSLSYYDKENDAWHHLSPIPSEAVSRGCSMATMFNYLFVALGWDGPGRHAQPSRRVLCYNPLTDSWKEISPLGEARPHCKLVALNGFLYAIGGECLHTVERYDPRQNRWSYVAPLPNDTFAVAHMATAYDDEIFVTGGTLRYMLLRYREREGVWKSSLVSGSKDRTTEMVAADNFLYRFDLNRSMGISVHRCNIRARIWYECARYPLPYPAPFQCAVIGGDIHCIGRNFHLRFLAEDVSPRFADADLRGVPAPKGVLYPSILALPVKCAC